MTEAPSGELSSNDNKIPIGIFDSGFGGLTVARAVIDQLPSESILYVGDTARGPYGPLPLAEVRSNALEVMDHLVEQNVKALVIACNSASAAVLRDARERYDVPVVEVIHPAVRRAVNVTKNQKIGVIGTEATVKSGAYSDALSANPNLEVFEQACPLFVEYVERGETSGPALEAVAQEYLSPLLSNDIDTLILGCTHYPLLTGLLRKVVGDQVTLVSSAEETANDVYSVLGKGNLLAPSGGHPNYKFTTTGDPEEFELLGRRFLGPVVVGVEKAL